ncbi:MAG: stage II sporulation protein M [Deltaproteobacteria bacterium]|nr:stage II sporulation protein M [Deltaproteobacteria bacterium]
MQEVKLRSSDFRRERERQWIELESLLEQADRRGLRSLSADDLHRLPALYRVAVSSLSVARAISLDRNMLDYLESLVARAYICIYSVKPRTGMTIRSFFTDDFPAMARRVAAGILLALVVMGTGVIVGYDTRDDPDAYHAIVPDEMAQGRTHTTSTEKLREVLYSGEERSGSELGFFATFLFTHNAKIGLLSFALGFALGLPTLLLLFYNGLILGAMAGLYASRGLGLEFWAWVLPHGVTELLAVCLCGGAGLALSLAVIRPGRHGRMWALSSTGKKAALVVLGAVAMFFVAGIIEGIFRQIVQDVPSRLAMAVATAGLWTVYFLLRGRAEPESR